MNKTIFITAVLFVFIACNTKNKDDVKEDTSFEISTQKWSKTTALNTKTANIINNWPEFKALQNSLEAIYDVSNTEDLSLVLEDLIEKQKLLKASVYPEDFDKAQIKSRQKVFHTFMLKAKGDLIYSVDADNSVQQMIEAYNAMLNQCNVITSNTLDLQKLLEEE